MYYGNGRKKAIIIAIIIVLIIVLGAGAIFAYLKTDLFKSDQMLFYKYLGKTIENFEYEQDAYTLEIENLKNEMPYAIVSTLAFEKGEENKNQSINMLSDLKLLVESNVDKIEEKTYTKGTLKYSNQDLFTLEYANSNNIYALKSDEIVTAFLGVENENLKILAQKLGINDTTMIPDQINEIDINSLLEISEEEKQHIGQTYLEVLLNNISQDNYKKENDLAVNKEGINYIVDAYRLDLNYDEYRNIQIELLETLKQDSITLNLITTKAKILGLDERYTKINNLTVEIENLIEQISSMNNEINEGFLSIIIYVDSGEVLTTEIILRNEIKLTMYNDKNENMTKTYFLAENLGDDSIDYTKVEIQLNKILNNAETNYDLKINLNDEKILDAYITNSRGTNQNMYNTNVEATLIQNDEVNGIITYNQQTTFKDNLEQDIISLDRTNCGVLNDYTNEQLQVLLQSISERVNSLFNEKIQTIGIIYLQNNIVEPIINKNNNEGEVEEGNDNTINNTNQINNLNITNSL